MENGENGEYSLKLDDYIKQLEAYRLLKVASQNNKNEVDALDFYRLEMRTLWTIRRIKSGRKTLSDNILIGAARLFSDFGQNWWLPLLWLFGFHLLFIAFLFQGHSEIIIAPFQTVKFLGQYFDLLNPVHKQPDWVNTSAGKLTDFVIRICSGYFTYHFVKASRKFGRI